MEGQVDQHRYRGEGCLINEGAPSKGSGSFWILRWGRVWEKRARSEKLLDTESGSGKMSSRSLSTLAPFLTHTEVGVGRGCWSHQPRDSDKRIRKENAKRSANTQRARPAWGPDSLTAAQFQRLQCSDCAPNLGGHLSCKDCQVEPS